MAYQRLRVQGDGTACMEVAWRRVGTVNPDEVNIYDGGTRDPGADYPPCPTPAGGPAGAAVLTPATFAASYWERVPLPAPEPRIAPGWGITGKVLYLETGGQLTFTHTTTDTPFGPLEIVASGTYDVDWGDGQRSGPHPTEGRPWPDGRITHTYRDVGAYDIVVTERWSATWRFGDQSGVLRELQTTATIDDFPLRQIQAVLIG